MDDQQTLIGGGDSQVTPNAAPVADGHWSSGFDDDTKPWLSGMGLDKLDERAALAKVLPMYRGAEQKLGIPPDQILRLPGKDAKPEEWGAVWSKLGAPDKPEGYELTLPDGETDDSFMKVATQWFHETKLPKGQAQAIAAKWNEYVTAQKVAQEGKFSAEADKDMAALREEWKGEEYNKNVSLAQKVRRDAGLSDEEALKIEKAIGVKRAAMFLFGLGKNFGEHRFLGNGGGSGRFSMSQEGARARISALQKDAGWMAAYLTGDVDKLSEFTQLNKIAHPDPVV